MPYSRNNAKHVGWKEYRLLLGSVGTFFMSVAVGTALLSSVAYFCWAPKIEQVTHRNLLPSWICLLLWFPIVIQLFVFSRLRKRGAQGLSESRFRAYFKFYFSR